LLLPPFFSFSFLFYTTATVDVLLEQPSIEDPRATLQARDFIVRIVAISTVFTAFSYNLNLNLSSTIFGHLPVLGRKRGFLDEFGRFFLEKRAKNLLVSLPVL
jgi:hypothetical protein